MLFRTFLTVLLALTLVSTIQASESEANSTVQPIRTTVGFAFGTPAGLNMSVGRYFGNQGGMRLSGGFLPGRGERYIVGFQISALGKISESRNSLFDASVTAGYSRIQTSAWLHDTWRYVGVACAVKWKLLFAEVGLTIGSGSYPNPQAMLQLGVVFYAERERKKETAE